MYLKARRRLTRDVVITVLVLAWLFQSPVLAAEVSFKDLPAADHWAFQEVEYVGTRALMLGFPDGAFLGDQGATRYELAAGLARLSRQLTGLIETGVSTNAADLRALSEQVQALEQALAEKADKAAVDSALAEKADRSAMDAALSGKADKAAMDAALAALAARIDEAAYDAMAGEADEAAPEAALNESAENVGPESSSTGKDGVEAISAALDKALANLSARIVTLTLKGKGVEDRLGAIEAALKNPSIHPVSREDFDALASRAQRSSQELGELRKVVADGSERVQTELERLRQADLVTAGALAKLTSADEEILAQVRELATRLDAADLQDGEQEKALVELRSGLETKSTELRDADEALSEKIAQADQTLSEKIAQLEKSLADKVAALEKADASLAERVARHDGEIRELQSTVKTLEEEVKTQSKIIHRLSWLFALGAVAAAAF